LGGTTLLLLFIAYIVALLANNMSRQLLRLGQFASGKMQLTNRFFHFNNHIAKRSFSTADEVIVNVPSMGDSISEGTVVSVKSNVRDIVNRRH
jgi:hypothetical protein